MKKYSKLIIIVAIVFTFQSGLTNADYCVIDESDWSAWETCKNQIVKIIGHISEFPKQHPTGLHNSFDPDTNELKIKFENYMDINGFQVVLTTDEKINCKGRIEVEGLVDIVDLGGQRGTKESYKNIWIKVMNFKCDE